MVQPVLQCQNGVGATGQICIMIAGCTHNSIISFGMDPVPDL